MSADVINIDDARRARTERRVGLALLFGAALLVAWLLRNVEGAVA